MIKYDLHGKKFNKLTVVNISSRKTRSSGTMWDCICECGNTTTVRSNHLRNGIVKSCGCLIELRDLRGIKFNRLTVIDEPPIRKGNRVFWRCSCECGKVVEIVNFSITSGRTKSCGCLHKDFLTKNKRTHGQSKKGKWSAEYRTWVGMKARCYNYKAPSYKYYGEKGISVCQRWLGDGGFKNFFEDMGKRPSDKHSLDRFPDKNGNYEPSNCRWTTVYVQANNKNNNVLITKNGVSKTIGEWSRITGIAYHTLYGRYVSGRSEEYIFSEVNLKTLLRI